jgi:general L-amino acid transport system permease protein
MADEGTMAIEATAGEAPARVAFYNNPKIRAVIYQIALVLIIGFLVYAAAENALTNLRRAHIVSGFGFWNQTAGFDISQTLISYSANASTYGRAFWVGLLNTLLVAGLGIVFATILGFIIGIGRLSDNYLVAKACTGYVETIRNIPLLLQLLFWYNAVLKALPGIRQSYELPFHSYLNNRGFSIPKPVGQSGEEVMWLLILAGFIAAFVFRYWAKRRQAATGQQAPVFLVGLALVIVPALVYILIAGFPYTFDIPKLGRFNLVGGLSIAPEFVALLFGLSIYTAAFIAEVVRAGILAVSRGQTEAAFALGLKPGTTLRLIVLPQAMRVIIPPLTSQYLNLTKNSTLAVAIGYPDLVQIFTGTVLNQTGQAVSVVAITMVVYLTISLTTSLAMNIYNSRMSLVER